MKNKTISKNRGARILAVQGAYLTHFINTKNLDNLITDLTALNEINFQDELLRNLLTYVNLHCETCDKIITDNLNVDWRFERLDLVVLSILRIAIGEFIFQSETSANLIINEYVSIAKYFLSAAETNFINGILQNISKILRPDTV